MAQLPCSGIANATRPLPLFRLTRPLRPDQASQTDLLCPHPGPHNEASTRSGRALPLRISLAPLNSTLANFVGDLTRIRRRDDRQAGAAPTGWAARAMHIFQAGARRPLYPSWAAMITSADGPSRASPDFPHIPVPLGCNKTPLGRTLLRRVPRQAPPKLAKVELMLWPKKADRAGLHARHPAWAVGLV